MAESTLSSQKPKGFGTEQPKGCATYTTNY